MQPLFARDVMLDSWLAAFLCLFIVVLSIFLTSREVTAAIDMR